MLWPNNKRLALMLSFDIDAETLWLTRNEINKNHPANLSRGLYSVKQGIPRILRMLEEENQHATFFTTAYTAELHPEVIKCIAACGHEIAYHGYLHEADGRTALPGRLYIRFSPSAVAGQGLYLFIQLAR